MKNTTITQIAAIVLMVVVVTAGVLYVRSLHKQLRQETEKKISTLEKRSGKVIDADSLRDVIESRILDSLKLEVDRQDAKIAEVSKQQAITRRQNEKLEKRFNDISVFMPDF
jgi:predicted nucleotidyltransferase